MTHFILGIFIQSLFSRMSKNEKYVYDANDHAVEQDANARAYEYFQKNVTGYNGWKFGENPIVDFNYRLGL